MKPKFVYTVVFTLLCLVLLQPFDSALTTTNVSYHFGFIPSKNGQSASLKNEPFKEIVQKHGAIFLGDITQRELYLTFDNGYENGYTPKILDILKKKQVPAIFFVTGQYVREEPELLKRMVAEGHLIGNHSWSHPDMSTISPQKIKEALNKVKEGVAQLTGQKDMKYIRTPRGVFCERTLAVSGQLGYTNVFWSVAYHDWDVQRQKGWRYAYDKVVSQFHPGAVILLHSISKDNTEALDRIIDEARKQGYVFKSLDQLKIKNY